MFSRWDFYVGGVGPYAQRAVLAETSPLSGDNCSCAENRLAGADSAIGVTPIGQDKLGRTHDLPFLTALEVTPLTQPLSIPDAALPSPDRFAGDGHFFEKTRRVVSWSPGIAIPGLFGGIPAATPGRENH